MQAASEEETRRRRRRHLSMFSRAGLELETKRASHLSSLARSLAFLLLLACEPACLGATWTPPRLLVAVALEQSCSSGPPNSRVLTRAHPSVQFNHIKLARGPANTLRLVDVQADCSSGGDLLPRASGQNQPPLRHSDFPSAGRAPLVARAPLSSDWTASERASEPTAQLLASNKWRLSLVGSVFRRSSKVSDSGRQLLSARLEFDGRFAWAE